jgi:Lon protease-like protein
MQATVISCPHSLDALRSNLNMSTECPICCTRFTQATTTPCGHTFCHNCLVRSLDHQRACPFCRDSLEFCPPPTRLLTDLLSQLYDMDDETADALDINDNRVPLLIGSMSFPHINCAIHVFEPRYRLMLRRIMASNRRRFAMCLAKRKRAEGEAPFYEYGTMLELMHVQTLPDGRAIVEAVGSHRFHVVNFELIDGYHMADIERIDDIDREQENLLEQQQILKASAMRARQQHHQQQQKQQQQQQQQQRPTIEPTRPLIARPMAASTRSNIVTNARPMATSTRPMATSTRPMAASIRPMAASIRPMAASTRPMLATRPRLAQQPQTMMMGQRQSWAQQAHPQTQPQISRAPWLQMHVQGLSAQRTKSVQPQQQQQPAQAKPISVPEQIAKNRQVQSTDEILDELATFIEKLIQSKNSNSTDGTATWLSALGEPPALRGPQRDRVILTWWIVNVMPLGDEEKLPLLAMRTLRERVLLVISWVDRFEDQWSFFLNNPSSSSSSTNPPVSCCIS